MNQILIFAGTFEGRKLCEYFFDHHIGISVCVATEYGKDVLPNMRVYHNRLDENEMADFINENQFDLVIDATHPYAAEVTKNIKKACEKTNKRYIRLLRDESNHQNLIHVTDTLSAVEFLKNTEGNILVTTGSKELSLFCGIPDYEKRVFARVLPSVDVLEQCHKIGIKGQNLICMQGPFSHHMNAAMLKQFHCNYLVTKNTGTAGGLDEKISAALETGTKVIMIDRPVKEEGYSLWEVIKLCKDYLNIKSIPDELESKDTISKKEFFPLFIQSKNKNILVVGGGEIAVRRILTLLKFEFHITVVAPLATDEIKKFAKEKKIDYLNRVFQSEDLNDKYMVISATNDRETNHYIGNLAKKCGVLANIADKKEECDFYFPAVVTDDTVVVGLTSEGRSHSSVKDVSNKIRMVLKSEN